MNPVHLETLLAIVEEGSFEVAASVLGISPSAVSQRIKALEASTGRVVVRRANPVGATEAGEILVQAARRMALVQSETDARLGQRLARVPLSVAINSDSLATWFTQVLSDTAQRGDVALRIRIEDEARTLAMLRRGDVLGAVTREHSPVSGCDSTFLGTMRYFAVAAPHIAEELWQRFGHDETITYQPFPTFEEKYLVDDEIEVPVQINGKVKARINVAADADQEAVFEVALADAKIAELTSGKNVVKKIYVPGRMVNLVVK